MTPRDIALTWFTDVWNRRDVPLITTLMASNAIGHLAGPIPRIEGPEQFIVFQNELLAALPDIEVTILNSLGDETSAAVLWEAKALKGTVTFRGTTWFRIVDGKIVEGWDCWDHGALAAKLANLKLDAEAASVA